MPQLVIPWELYPLFFVVALLYSSVGHGGASGYLAVFALFGITTPAIAPVALVLNILVASASFWRYVASGHFSARMLAPLVLLSIPAAFAGGALHLSQQLFSLILGIALVAGAFRILLLKGNDEIAREPSQRTLWTAGLPLGAALGLLSGITGIGGGVFLSPILVMTRWATIKQSAALAGAFIVLNSISGLIGQLTRTPLDPRIVLPLAAVVVAGGATGSYIGAERLRARWLQIVLSLVLLSAGGKLVLNSL